MRLFYNLSFVSFLKMNCLPDNVINMTLKLSHSRGTQYLVFVSLSVFCILHVHKPASDTTHNPATNFTHTCCLLMHRRLQVTFLAPARIISLHCSCSSPLYKVWEIMALKLYCKLFRLYCYLRYKSHYLETSTKGPSS